jgi:hypothetical protein
MMLKSLIANAAPGLATALGGPMAGMAVKMMADKLGVAPTEQAVADHLTHHPEHLVRLQEIDLEKLKADHANTADARKMNAEIQLSAAASFLAKNTAYIIDFVIVGATIIMTWLLFFKGVPDANKELAYMAFGSLLTLSGTVVNFHRGSSQGSKEKEDKLKGLAK